MSNFVITDVITDALYLIIHFFLIEVGGGSIGGVGEQA